jgi:hypothetical protein
MSEEKPHPVTVYLVIAYTPDKQIERVFRTQDQAIAYIKTYEASHDYYCEAEVLTD